jgi:hypothetical protein
MITSRGEYHRFAVETEGVDRGRFVATPKRPELDEDGTRKVLNLARSGDHDQRRGPAFALLPIKPEPAGSACVACYLINTENLGPSNPWVSAVWSDGAQPIESGSIGSDDFDLLVASPGGKLYHLSKRGDAAPVAAEVELAGEPEIWQQLRNGCIAGSALFEHHPDQSARVVPLVNVTPLLPHEG